MNREPKMWSKEEVQRLLDLQREGKNPTAIAEEFDRSVSSVARKLESIKLFGQTATRHSVRSATDTGFDLLRERDRVAKLDTRSPGEVLLGTPPLHRSALFKKNGHSA